MDCWMLSSTLVVNAPLSRRSRGFHLLRKQIHRRVRDKNFTLEAFGGVILQKDCTLIDLFHNGGCSLIENGAFWDRSGLPYKC
jgi:hypothetical protein